MAGLWRGNLRKHVSIWAAIFSLAFSGAVEGQDKIERLKDGLVRIEVRTGPNSPKIMGTGFVIAANGSAVTILTARHLFYKEDGDALAKAEAWVTFYIDRQHSPRKARLLSPDSSFYEFAVLEISAKDLSGLNAAQLARFELRATNLGPREHVLVVGSDGDGWLAPEMIVASLAYQNRPDQFMYSGTGIGGGFSGQPRCGPQWTAGGDSRGRSQWRYEIRASAANAGGRGNTECAWRKGGVRRHAGALCFRLRARRPGCAGDRRKRPRRGRCGGTRRMAWITSGFLPRLKDT